MVATIAALGVVTIVGSGGGGFPDLDFSGPFPPSASIQPSRVTVQVGATETFTSSAVGTLPISYQWHRNGVDIAGATGTTYSLVGVNLADDGAQFSVTATNRVGADTATGLLRVSSSPGVVYQDGDFQVSDWAVTAGTDPPVNGPTHTESQSTAGGNPGAFRVIAYEVPHGSSSIRVFHTALFSTYDSRAQGAIYTVDFAQDCKRLSTSTLSETYASPMRRHGLATGREAAGDAVGLPKGLPYPHHHGRAVRARYVGDRGPCVPVGAGWAVTVSDADACVSHALIAGVGPNTCSSKLLWCGPSSRRCQVGRCTVPCPLASVVVVFPLVPDRRNHNDIANDLEERQVAGMAERDHELAQEWIAPVACLAAPQSGFRERIHRAPDGLDGQMRTVEVRNGLRPLEQRVGEPVQVLVGLVRRYDHEPHVPSTCARLFLIFASSLSNVSSTVCETPVRLYFASDLRAPASKAA